MTLTHVETFREIVEADIRDAATETQSQMLRDPENVEQWYWTLIAVKKSTESQLGSRKAGIRASDLGQSARTQQRREFYSWKTKILRFKNGTEERLIEARNLRHTSWMREDVILEERNVALETVSILRKAIYTHKTSITAEPTDADEALWNMI